MLKKNLIKKKIFKEVDRMLDLTLKEIADLCGGMLNDEKYGHIKIDNVSIDTRTIQEKDLYVPIIGEKLDGHLFIDQAFDKKASASICEKNKQGDFYKYPLILVDDSNEAFTLLAKNYRKSLKDIKIIGITGSNGKTSTKDLLSLIFSRSHKTAKTIGNLNNHIGVPRTLLTFDKSLEYGFVEMGTDGYGQIDHLTNLVKPDLAILTNVGDSHLHTLKTKENVAKEKVDIINGLAEDGYFIYNYDDPYIKEEVKNRDIKVKTVTFGQDSESDYVIEIVKTSSNGSSFRLNGEEFITSYVGTHQVYNASVAIIVAKIYGLDMDRVKRQLEINKASSMRSELMNCNGFDILNDSYKSNPQSVISALETLDVLNGYTRKIAILGDMLELGNDEENLHRQIGKHIDPTKVDYLLLTGPLSIYIAEEAKKKFPTNTVFHFDKKDKLIDKAKYLIKKNSLVLVKASRSLRLEEVVDSIKEVNI